FWQNADSPFLVCSSVAVVSFELRRADGTAAGEGIRRGEAFFLDCAILVRRAARRSCNCCDDYCQPGDNHRLFLDDPASDAVGVASWGFHPPDLRPGVRPDLCARGQLVVDGGHSNRNHRFWYVGSLSRRLWDGG